MSDLNYDPHFVDTEMEARIDATLRHLGSAMPRQGIEQRIAARLESAAVQRAGFFSTSRGFFGLPRLALASAAGLAACVAMIAGSVNHSHHIQLLAPGVQLPGAAGGAVGAADGKAVAPKPVTAPAHGRPRSMRKLQGTVDGQKPDGVAVPKAPPQKKMDAGATGKP